MAEADISRIINLIMTNPGLIEQIKALSAKDSESAEVKSDTDTPIEEKNAEKAEESFTDTAIERSGISEKNKRSELLRALKPYVRAERSKAIESMISIADILDMVREK